MVNYREAVIPLDALEQKSILKSKIQIKYLLYSHEN